MTQSQNKPANTKNVNPWLVIAFIAIPVFIGSLDLTVVSAFLPELIIELELPLQDYLDDTSWVLSGYLLAYTISLTFTGRLSDLIGRRAVYVGCLMIFIVGSILVATAQGAPSDWLYSTLRRFGQRPDPAVIDLIAVIIGRVVQALGAGALVPVSMALVSDMFPPETPRATARLHRRAGHARLGARSPVRRITATGQRADRSGRGPWDKQ